MVILRLYAFVRSKYFRRKKNCIETVLITSFTLLLTCILINPPTQVFLFVTICENLLFLWESFWIFFICVNLLFYDRLCESIFVTPYENKQAYESDHLKQIFYHQNTIMIFCWLPKFPFYVFYFEFFSFCVWVLFD